MIVTFPLNPSLGQTHVFNGLEYSWNGESWSLQADFSNNENLDIPYIILEPADDLQTALNTGKAVFLKPNTTYNIQNKFYVPDFGVLLGPRSARLVSTVVGVMAEIGNYACLSGFSAEGLNTGCKGFLIKSGANLQFVDNVRFIFNEEALIFEPNGGSDFSSTGGLFVTLRAPGLGAAIKVAGVDTAGIPRKFVNPAAGGCTLFDFGGCNDFFASNFYSAGILMGASSSKLMIVNARIGSQSGNVQLRGTNHVLANIVFATEVDCYTQDSRIDCVVGAWAVNDFGTGNSIEIKQRQYTPILTTNGSSSQQPFLGNGTITAFWSRNGNVVRVVGEFVVGSTTNLGAGVLYLSLPPLNAHENYGWLPALQGVAQKVGVRPSYIAVPVLEDTRDKISFAYQDNNGTSIVIEKIGSSISNNSIDISPNYFPNVAPDLDNAVEVFHNGIRLWKNVGTRKYSTPNTNTVSLNFTPAATDTIVIVLNQPATRNVSGNIEKWPTGSRLRFSFSYNCK